VGPSAKAIVLICPNSFLTIIERAMDKTDDDIEPGMKFPMGRGVLEHIGTVLRLKASV
jgi:hypothetical protein